MELRTPSLSGSSGEDSPNLTGWGTAVNSGDQESSVSENERDFFRENWDFISSDLVMPDGGKGIESPIERAFFRCFRYLMLGMGDEYQLTIHPQVKIGRYIADFTINSLSGAILLVVECDGHDYHAGDKAGAARDRERDRWFVSGGYSVFRFTGTQIYQRPFLCAADTITCALKRRDQANA